MSKLGPDGLATDDYMCDYYKSHNQDLPPVDGTIQSAVERAIVVALFAERDALLEAMDEMPEGKHHRFIGGCLTTCPACAVERFKAEFRKKVRGA